MDQLIKDVSAGTYSTKKSFAVTRWIKESSKSSWFEFVFPRLWGDLISIQPYYYREGGAKCPHQTETALPSINNTVIKHSATLVRNIGSHFGLKLTSIDRAFWFLWSCQVSSLYFLLQRKANSFCYFSTSTKLLLFIASIAYPPNVSQWQ